MERMPPSIAVVLLQCLHQRLSHFPSAASSARTGPAHSLARLGSCPVGTSFISYLYILSGFIDGVISMGRKKTATCHLGLPTISGMDDTKKIKQIFPNNCMQLYEKPTFTLYLLKFSIHLLLMDTICSSAYGYNMIQSDIHHPQLWSFGYQSITARLYSLPSAVTTPGTEDVKSEDWSCSSQNTTQRSQFLVKNLTLPDMLDTEISVV